MKSKKGKGKNLIRAISLWEPWASLIATGAKTVETRSWHTEVRGSLLICAAMKKDMEAMKLLDTFPFQNGLQGLFKKPEDTGFRGICAKDLNFGKAVALVELKSVHTTEYMLEDEYSFIEDEEAFGDFSTGRYAWVFSNIKRIKEPFPVKGKQGFFFVEMPEGVEFV